MRLTNLALILLILVGTGVAQGRLPVIDMHLHALSASSRGAPPLAICSPIEEFPAWDPARPYPEVWMDFLKNPPCSDPIWSPLTDDELRDRTIEILKQRRVFGVLSGSPERVSQWMEAAPGLFYPGLLFQIDGDQPSPDSLRQMHQANRLAVLGEVTNQYVGILPDDPRMEPYWALAAELDIPVGIHIGPGPPGVFYLGSSGYRARFHSVLTLEEVLVRHPSLRVYIMHAGYPILDDLLALLYAHPQVYAGIGVIVYTQPRADFYQYLRSIVSAGFGKRVLFGSDQMVWPESILRSIAVIETAPFLTAGQKRDILYNNAARFLRLSKEEMARHLQVQPK